MNKFKITIAPEAIEDIHQAVLWYNEQLEGLGQRFSTQVKTSINSLKTNPQRHSIRYNEVRCLLIKKFPFLVHYTIHESQNIVEIFAVFHTSRNPKIWEKR